MVYLGHRLSGENGEGMRLIQWVRVRCECMLAKLKGLDLILSVKQGILSSGMIYQILERRIQQQIKW